jgi:hypothetical protein
VAVTQRLKKEGHKEMYNILLIVDDFADDPSVCHSSRGMSAGGSILNTLFLKGRHSFISTLVSTQKLRLLSSSIRVNAQFLLVWRLRNALEKKSLLEELSAVYPVDTLEQMYHLATDEPYSFWYVLLTAKSPSEMFYKNFEHKMHIN